MVSADPGFLVAGVGGFIAVKRNQRGRDAWDAFKLRIPMKIGEVVQKVAIARWSRTLSALTSAGVPIMQAIEITGKTAGNAVIERSMGDVITSVKSGGTISAPLRDCPAFPPMVAQMVGVGEETGALDSMLAKIADFYDSEVEAAVKALTSIMEPVMIIFVGGIVGVIVISHVPAAVLDLQLDQVGGDRAAGTASRAPAVGSAACRPSVPVRRREGRDGRHVAEREGRRVGPRGLPHSQPRADAAHRSLAIVADDERDAR